jgi:small GTP-binding protein
MQSVKIVITGPFNAGKTTFIRTVSEIAVLSTERQVSEGSGETQGETTVAMDFGRITISDEVVLYLFGTPGQERFSFMWETLAEGMLGFVVLVDGTSEESVRDAMSMIGFFTDMSEVPFVVAVNRVEPKDAFTLGSLRTTLSLAEEVPLIGIDARRKDDVVRTLLALLYRISGTME